MKVVFSDKAGHQYEQITACILHKYGQLSREKFTSKLEKKFIQLIQFPESSQELEGFPGYYRSVLTKQTTLFYTVDYYTQELKIISVFDTRQDPDNLNTEID